MKTPLERIKEILENLKVDVRDNLDMAMMGDQRGRWLYAITNKEDVAKQLLDVFENPGITALQRRLEAAEDFIKKEGSYNWGWDARFHAYNKWKELTKDGLQQS